MNTVKREKEYEAKRFVESGENFELTRDGKGQSSTNFPHTIVYYSPSGLDWGAGSGPAETALNILFLATGNFNTAWSCHQKFKAEVIGKIPFHGGIIRLEDVRAWLDDNRQCWRSDINLFSGRKSAFDKQASQLSAV